MFKAKSIFIVSLLAAFLNLSNISICTAGSPEGIDMTAAPGNASQPLDLAECLRIAMDANPDVARKFWETEVSKADQGIARSKLQPNVRLSGSYMHSADPQAIIKARRVGDPVPYQDDIYSGDMSLTYPLFNGRRLENKAKMAEFQVKSQEKGYEYSRDEISYSLTSVFYTILGQHRVIESLRFSCQTLLEHQKRVNELFVAKKAAKVDLLRTEVRIADLQQRLIKEEGWLDVLYCHLGNLMGDVSLVRNRKLAGDLAISEMPVDMDKAGEQALQSREDYLALKLKLAGQRANLAASRAERQPDVSLRASYGNRWPGKADLGSQEVGEVYVMASFPVFDGGQINSGIRREKAQLRVLQESLRKLELKIRLEVETAISNLKSASAREAVSKKAVEQAEESFRIEREKYEHGKGAILDVLDAQNALLDAQTNCYRAMADFKIAQASYQMAGGVIQ